MTGKWELVAAWGFAALLVALVLISLDGTAMHCDVKVPVWVESNGGCAEMPPVWEYLYPWHWGAPDKCLGPCLMRVP